MQERVDLNLSYKTIIVRGIKKMLVEITSLKFLTLIFIGYLTAAKTIQDYIGVSGMFALLGMREGFEYLSGGKEASKFVKFPKTESTSQSPKCYD